MRPSSTIFAKKVNFVRRTAQFSLSLVSLRSQHFSNQFGGGSDRFEAHLLTKLHHLWRASIRWQDSLVVLLALA